MHENYKPNTRSSIHPTAKELLCECCCVCCMMKKRSPIMMNNSIFVLIYLLSFSYFFTVLWIFFKPNYLDGHYSFLKHLMSSVL